MRALQDAFGHRPAGGDVAVATDPADSIGLREPIDRITAPLSWYSGVPQTIANGAIWCSVAWLLTRDRRSAFAPAAALALETACFVASAALTGRPRPERVWRPEQPHATSSFPSGHTAAAFALHGTLADLLDRHGARGARLLGPLLRYGIPTAIAFSRIYRGQHHISDTVAGVTGTVERRCGATRADVVVGGRTPRPAAPRVLHVVLRRPAEVVSRGQPLSVETLPSGQTQSRNSAGRTRSRLLPSAGPQTLTAVSPACAPSSWLIRSVCPSANPSKSSTWCRSRIASALPTEHCPVIPSRAKKRSSCTAMATRSGLPSGR